MSHLQAITGSVHEVTPHAKQLQCCYLALTNRHARVCAKSAQATKQRKTAEASTVELQTPAAKARMWLLLT
jgi:hypothetical protein